MNIGRECGVICAAWLAVETNSSHPRLPTPRVAPRDPEGVRSGVDLEADACRRLRSRPQRGTAGHHVTDEPAGDRQIGAPPPTPGHQGGVG